MSLLKDMLHHAVHIGSDAKHWSPAMKPYIHGTQNGIHVFDLTKTEAHLEETKKALEEFCKSGKELLIVGTKVQTQKIASDLAEKTGHSSVTAVWVPGLLTNYTTIKGQVREYNKIRKISKQVKSIVSTKKKKLWRWLVSAVSKNATKVSKRWRKLLMEYLSSMVTTSSRQSKKPMYSVSLSLLSSVPLVNQNSVITSSLQMSIISSLSSSSPTNSLHQWSELSVKLSQRRLQRNQATKKEEATEETPAE
jgi:hypothetical protein